MLQRYGLKTLNREVFLRLRNLEVPMANFTEVEKVYDDDDGQLKYMSLDIYLHRAQDLQWGVNMKVPGLHGENDVHLKRVFEKLWL